MARLMAPQGLLALPARQPALGSGGACKLSSLSVAGRGLAMLRSLRQKEERGPGSECFSIVCDLWDFGRSLKLRVSGSSSEKWGH